MLRSVCLLLLALGGDFAFEPPKDVVFVGRWPGGNGPDLRVQVKLLDSARIEYDVTGGDRPRQIIVERKDAEHVHVISRGADGQSGADGSSGRDGFSGSPGTSAMCPSSPAGDGGRGEDGTPGEDGASGTAGGNGGNVVVEVERGGDTDALLAIVRRTVLSQGGSGGGGGWGGRGGRGGPGGTGGISATCVDGEGHVSTLNGGSPGANGFDGRSGFNGTRGSDGSSGRVMIRLVP